MDEIQLRKALAKLRSFADNLPKGKIEAKYVNLYHAVLADIQNEMGHDLAYFHIPSGEIRPKWEGSIDGEDLYSREAFCDHEIFMINFNGALNFIASFLEQPERRIIGFA